MTKCSTKPLQTFASRVSNLKYCGEKFFPPFLVVQDEPLAYNLTWLRAICEIVRVYKVKPVSAKKTLQ